MNANNPAFSIVLMGLLILMIYFMMIRPQKKKDKADREMRAALKVGDEIITIGGIIGKVEKITEKTIVISTTANKNKIEFLKTAIASVNPSTDGTGSKPAQEETKEEETKAPSRDKKVTPKKLSKKSEDASESKED
jgi:preprotein translocase subunit YajC